MRRRVRQIEGFQSIYVSGSISAAARSLNVSQPSVSKVLRHTEDQIGFKLFALSRGRLVATDEAHALFREVRETFEQLRRSEEHTSELQSLMRISYAVFCLKKKKHTKHTHHSTTTTQQTTQNHKQHN